MPYLAVALTWLMISSALAAEPAAPAAKPAQVTSNSPKVLDFEAEVIEGQRKAPDLFLQSEVETPALDSVLFQRKDFNDFHAVDAAKRPRLADPNK